jgi:hypothetical protein
MFKKFFQSLSETLATKEEPKPGSWVSAKKKTTDKARSLLDKISATLSPTAGGNGASAVRSKAGHSKKSPEQLCGISSKMTKDEIKARLALLYRRYNRASSSLDSKLRAESESMLDAIVAVREKTFGPI